MIWLHRAKHLVIRLFRSTLVEEELEDEVKAHYKILADREIARGLSSEEAARSIRVRFGGPDQVTQLVREQRMGVAIDNTLRDLRYAWRGLARSPGFAVFAVITIALGLGVNTAMFSVVDGVLLKSSGYPDAGRIVQLWEMPPKASRNTISAADFRDWAQQSQFFEWIGARDDASMSYTGGDHPQLLRAAMVSPAYFHVFGVSTFLGRTFADSEDQPGKEKVVVLSHHVWVTLFAADRTLIGKTIRLNGAPYIVTGVLPGNSSFDRQAVDVWVPLVLPTASSRNYNYLTAVAKLKPGVTLQQAQAGMNAVANRIAALYPADREGWGVMVDSYLGHLVGPAMQRSLTLLMLAVLAVLTIACANLSNLLMARATTRSREIALRAALGAGRGRIVRMLLTESLLISGGGAMAGIILGYALLNAIVHSLPPHYFPPEASIGMDSGVLFFLAAATVVTSLAIGILPALQASRRDSAEALKEGGRSSSDRKATLVRNMFITGQIAAAFVLLVGAGLLIRSFQALLQVDIGFDSKGVVAVGLLLSAKPNTDAKRLVQYTGQLVQAIRAEPGVVNAAVTTVYPLRGWGIGMFFRLPQDKKAVLVTGVKIVTPGYFQTLGLRLLAGRRLDEHDTSGAPPVLVINESFAKRFFPNSNALGKRIFMNHLLPTADGFGPESGWEVVGIVADEKANGLEGQSNVGVYASYTQNPIIPRLALLARGTVSPGVLIASVRRAVRRVNKDQVLDHPMTIDQIKADSMMSRTLSAAVLAGFSLLATFLASAGIYGVLSFVTARRTQEFGIRMALGANRMNLIWLVLSSGAKPVFAGIVIGLLGALALGRSMRSMLFGIESTDVPTLVGVTAILLIVAITACLLPAWRSTRIDPISALRQE